MSSIDPEVDREVKRRRTFAIISHPDAGKTTLTEKLLLYGGMLEVAGAIRGRKSQRAVTSDWMELERQRGISVSSTVLTFDFEGCRVNLLDTPGHHDFSEDTYRTLVASDCAVMVIDLAKGVETQTEKLFRVCALRKIPVITFVNKVDRPGQDTLAVLNDVETKLGIEAVPQNWPLGTGVEFCGIVDVDTSTAHIFDDKQGERRVIARSMPLSEVDDPRMRPEMLQQTRDEVELMKTAGAEFDEERFRRGEITPVYFGSALTNFGVENFLRGFLKLCPTPGNRNSDVGPIQVNRSQFAGFVFKIQANLDPRHRDRVAFLRICAGKFEREMEVLHPRSGKRIKLKRAHRVFGQDRETMDEAFPGDIIGLVNPGEFHLGDTICIGEPVQFESLPQFSPEHFAVLRCRDTSRRKQFTRGLEQLIEEGAIQTFVDPHAMQRDSILGAVGALQFDVVRFRLESEYNTPTDISPMPFSLARWITSTTPEDLREARVPYGAKVVRDQLGYLAILFASTWDANYFEREHPKIKLSPIRETVKLPGQEQMLPPSND